MVAKIEVTPYQIAERFIGLREIVGPLHSPLVLAMLQLDAKWVEEDETPWCSAFVNAIAWLLKLERTRNLAARSWLKSGLPVPLTSAEVGWDIAVLSRPPSPTSGHVGFYAGHSDMTISLLGGNQGNAVSVATFSRSRLVQIRRLRPILMDAPPPPLHV
jgi:uncharacterized protein (TIGR02594 family)